MRDCFTSVESVVDPATGKFKMVTVTCAETIAALKAHITRLSHKSSTDSDASFPPKTLTARLKCGEFFLYEVQYFDLEGNTRVALETGICHLNRDHPSENLHRTDKGAPQKVFSK